MSKKKCLGCGATLQNEDPSAIGYTPELEMDLKDALTDVTDLVFDFEKLEYISSAGLRVLLATQKVMNKKGSMKVIHVCETIMEIFDVTGFTDILTIE